MSSLQPSSKITLEDIAQRKQRILQDIHLQKKAMIHTAKKIFAPLEPEGSKANSIMRSFNTGMALFDGVMMGIKIMRKVRLYFSRLK